MKNRKVILLIPFLLLVPSLCSCETLDDDSILELKDEPVEKICMINYGVPETLKGMILTYNDIDQLISQNSTPKEVKEKITTIEEAIYYTRSLSKLKNGYIWNNNLHRNNCCLGAEEELKQNQYCCCGGAANVFIYLLQGDYEDIGVLRWCNGKKKSHVVIWIQQNDIYYIIDSTLIGFNIGRNPQKCTIAEVNDLKYFKEAYPSMDGNESLNEISLIIAYTHDGSDLYNTQIRRNDILTVYVPNKKNYEVTLIYKDSNASLSCTYYSKYN